MAEAVVSAGDQANLPASVTIGDAEVVLWPETQRIEPLSAPLMALTQFDGHARYHAELAATILECGSSKAVAG